MRFTIRRGACCVAALVPALALATGWQRADRSSDTWARDYAERLLKGLEPGALLFAEEDNVVFPLLPTSTMSRDCVPTSSS